MTQGEMFSDLALEQQYDNMIKALDMNKETLEEAAARISLTNSVYESCQDDFYQGFIECAKWYKEQDKDNSKEKLRLAFTEGHRVYQMVTDNTEEAQECFEEWYEQFKKNNY